MIEIKIENENVFLSFPKEVLAYPGALRFIDYLELEKIVEKSELSKEKVWELSEEIKKNWWQKNKKKFLEKIKK